MFPLSATASGATTPVWSYNANGRTDMPFHLQPVSIYMRYLVGPTLDFSYKKNIEQLDKRYT